MSALPDLSNHDLGVSHRVEWLWWADGSSGTVDCESLQEAMGTIAEMHADALEVGLELSTVYTRKTYRKEHDKHE
jgi:hypothetical protein